MGRCYGLLALSVSTVAVSCSRARRAARTLRLAGIQPASTERRSVSIAAMALAMSGSVLFIVVSVGAGRNALRVTDHSRCVGTQPTR